MTTEKQEPGAVAHTLVTNVPVKPAVRSTIRPLCLTADPREHNADPSLHNVIVSLTEYKRLKERNTELEEQYRAITTSDSVLQPDVKEVETKTKDLEKHVQELEAKLEVERGNGLEYARRDLLLRTENDGSKALLSQMGGGELSAADEMITGGGWNGQ